MCVSALYSCPRIHSLAALQARTRRAPACCRCPPLSRAVRQRHGDEAVAGRREPVGRGGRVSAMLCRSTEEEGKEDEGPRGASGAGADLGCPCRRRGGGGEKEEEPEKGMAARERRTVRERRARLPCVGGGKEEGEKRRTARTARAAPAPSSVVASAPGRGEEEEQPGTGMARRRRGGSATGRRAGEHRTVVGRRIQM